MPYCGQLRGGIKMFGFEIPSTMSVYCAMNDFCLRQHGDVISRSITPRQNAMVQLDTQCAVPPTTKKAGQNKCAAKDGNEKRRSGGRRNKKNKKGKHGAKIGPRLHQAWFKLESADIKNTYSSSLELPVLVVFL